MSGGGHEAGIDVTLPAILLFLLMGVFAKQGRKYLPSWFQLPYTVIMFLFGVLVTAISTEFHGSIGRIGRSIDLWLGVHPHVILLAFLPPLLFESAFDMDYNVFQRVAGQAVLLAVPGVLLSLGLTALYVRLFFTSYNWGWDMCLLLGSILSATDPVAVVAVLKTLGAPKKLASLIEGESLLNDGSAFVLFLIFKDMAAGHDQSVGSIIVTFVQLSLGGPAFGLLCAWVAYFFLYFVYNDPLVEITGVVAAVFSIFMVSELSLHVSSVLAVVVFGLFFAKEGKYALSREVHHIGHAVWAQIGHISNTIIFGISGLIFYHEAFNDDDIYKDATNWGLLILNFVMLHVVRFIVILVMYPLTSKMGYGLTWKECAIMWFGALRGAVGLALGLLVALEEGIPTKDAHLLNFHVAGIVCLTLLINGTLAGAFYKWIKPYPDTSPFKIRLFKKSLEVLQMEMAETQHALKHKWYFKHTNWSLVNDLLPKFDEIRFDHGHIFLDDLQTVNQCFRKARFKNLWTGGFQHARRAVRSGSSGTPVHSSPLATSGMVDAVAAALNQSSRPPSEDSNTVPLTALDEQMASVGAKSVREDEHLPESKAGEPAETTLVKPMNRPGQSGSVSLAPGLAVLMQPTIMKTTSSSNQLCRNAMRSLRHMDVHKREEVCQIIFTTVKAYYHAMYEDRYLDSSAMLILLDSLDKGTEAARQFNKDPGTPITISYKRLRRDIREVRFPTSYMLGLSTRFACTRAMRAMVEYSRAKRNHEALHAFIEAHERILQADDYRSDLDPQVTDDVASSVESAHKLLLELRREAPLASSVLTAVMATKVILNEQRGKIMHLYHEEGMLDEGVKEELIDLVEARLFDLHSFFPSPFVLGIKQAKREKKGKSRGTRVTVGQHRHANVGADKGKPPMAFGPSAPVKPDMSTAPVPRRQGFM